ncbi:NmrA family transcriptional regulator [Streptomyces carminius]|uniref:NmrA family transcriptional regulator n=1 Tax=Streptomyces carminius TaxID=2665496 RepID=A0A2M8LVK6_9ACTN|nr:NmrA family NAD(P)-binding protein [Streptomyces carminius]PJE95991.1 NmrA family transcriptional regulator [Streptomyces carminius]
MTGGRRRTFLVTGATGAQGGAVTRLLAGRGHAVRGLARRPAAAGPGTAAVEWLSCDLGDADGVRRAFEGVTRASVVLPLVYEPETVLRYARNIADAARGAGVERLVYNTNTPLPEEGTPYPGFETRRAAEAVLRGSGVPTVVLRPTVYLDNLFGPWHGPALVDDGVLAYPLPAWRRVAWLALDDLAAATVAALEDRDGLAGPADGVVELGGAEAVTGPELAAVFSSVLGREVVYRPLGADVFETSLAGAVGAESAAGVAGVYRYAAGTQAPRLFAPDPSGAARALGVRPVPLAEWVGGRPWERWSGAAAG